MRIRVGLFLAMCMPTVVMAQPFLYWQPDPDPSKSEHPQMKICTLAGCVESISISLAVPKTGWLPGRYEFIAAAGKTQRSCELVVVGPSWQDVECQSDAHSPRLEVQLAPDGSYMGLYGSTPRRVRFELRYQGRVVAKGRYLARYRTYYPNGRACGGSCSVGQPLPPLKVRALKTD